MNCANCRQPISQNERGRWVHGDFYVTCSADPTVTLRAEPAVEDVR